MCGTDTVVLSVPLSIYVSTWEYIQAWFFLPFFPYTSLLGLTQHVSSAQQVFASPLQQGFLLEVCLVRVSVSPLLFCYLNASIKGQQNQELNHDICAVEHETLE